MSRSDRLPDAIHRDLFERCADGILVIRGDRIVMANAAAGRILGAPGDQDQIVNRSLIEMAGAASRDQLTKWLRALESGTVPSTCEVRIERAHASFAVELAGAPLNDGTVHVALRDVSERRRVDVRIRESEERLTLAFAGAQEGVWDWNLETGAVVYSPRWKQMLGYADDEIEPHVRAWERLLHPDDRRARSRSTKRSCAAAAPTKASSGSGTRTATTSTCSRAAARSSRARRSRSCASSARISTSPNASAPKSALRESEERLTLAFAGAQEGVWDWNLETGRGRVLVALEGDARLRGRRDRAARQRLGASACIPTTGARATRANESVARGEPTYEAEFRLRHKDGHYVHVLSRGFPVRREPGGPVVRIVGTHFDLTRTASSARGRTGPHRAARPARVRAGGRTPPHRARDARSVRRAADGARPRDRLLKDACADRPRSGARTSTRSRPSRSGSTATSIISSGSCGRPRSTISACAPRSPTTSRTGRRASASPRELHTSGLLDDRLPSEVETDALPHRAGSADQRRQARAAPSTSRSSSSGGPTTSC